MMTNEGDTLKLDSDVPIPMDRRGHAEKLPSGLKSTIESMSVGQSFEIGADDSNATRKVGAIRAMIQRCVNSTKSPIQFFYVFSVRVQKNSETDFAEGVRVWRLDDRDAKDE
tara:strand:+ start:202 stop:537 length:336 start_codon:yes stop_codon:yes gene_type:complete